MADKECKSKCVGAGAMLTRSYSMFKESMVSPIIFDENLLTRPEDMRIPSSELAMHIGAADKSIIAFFVTVGGSAHVVYDTGDGCCAFTSGLDSELLSHELRRQVKDYMPRRLEVREGPRMV